MTENKMPFVSVHSNELPATKTSRAVLEPVLHSNSRPEGSQDMPLPVRARYECLAQIGQSRNQGERRCERPHPQEQPMCLAWSQVYLKSSVLAFYQLSQRLNALG